MVIVEPYLYQRIQDLDCMPASKIELSATEVNGFQCKAVATKGFILEIADVPDPPLVTIFGKVILI